MNQSSARGSKPWNRKDYNITINTIITSIILIVTSYLGINNASYNPNFNQLCQPCICNGSSVSNRPVRPEWYRQEFDYRIHVPPLQQPNQNKVQRSDVGSMQNLQVQSNVPRNKPGSQFTFKKKSSST